MVLLIRHERRCRRNDLIEAYVNVWHSKAVRRGGGTACSWMLSSLKGYWAVVYGAVEPDHPDSAGNCPHGGYAVQETHVTQDS